MPSCADAVQLENSLPVCWIDEEHSRLDDRSHLIAPNPQLSDHTLACCTFAVLWMQFFSNLLA